MQFIIDNSGIITLVVVALAIWICSGIIKARRDEQKGFEDDIRQAVKRLDDSHEGCDEADVIFISIRTLVLEEGVRIPPECGTLKNIFDKACSSLNRSIAHVRYWSNREKGSAFISDAELEKKRSERLKNLKGQLASLKLLDPGSVRADENPDQKSFGAEYGPV